MLERLSVRIPQLEIVEVVRRTVIPRGGCSGACRRCNVAVAGENRKLSAWGVDVRIQVLTLHQVIYRNGSRRVVGRHRVFSGAGACHVSQRCLLPHAINAEFCGKAESSELGIGHGPFLALICVTACAVNTTVFGDGRWCLDFELDDFRSGRRNVRDNETSGRRTVAAAVDGLERGVGDGRVVLIRPIRRNGLKRRDGNYDREEIT